MQICGLYKEKVSTIIGVTRKTLQEEAKFLENEGYEVWLHYARTTPNKKYNLGDSWGVDRESKKIRGKRYHRFTHCPEDNKMIEDAWKRGCK